MSRARARIPLALVASLLGGGCEYVFDRAATIRAGEVTGRAVQVVSGGRAEQPPASFAFVGLQGGFLVRQARSDGTFSVGGLPAGPLILHFSHDDRGNGVPKRTALRAARIGPCAACGDNRLGGVALGDVALDGPFDIRGEVALAVDGAPISATDQAFLGRVVVTRELCVPRDLSTFTTDCAELAANEADRLSTGVEALSPVDGAGAFRIDGVGSGSVFLYAMAFAETLDGAGLGELVAVSPPVELTGDAGDALEAAPIVVDLAAHAVAPVRVAVGLAPPPSGPVRLIFAPGVVASCDLAPPPGATVHEVEGAAEVSVTTRPGILSITACTEDERGVLTNALILPPQDPQAPALVGPIILGRPDTCGAPRDCDQDGAQGMPALSSPGDGAEGGGDAQDPGYVEALAIWQACTAACADALGADAGDAVCETEGTTYDCDDDGDGQPDVTEAQCYGPGLGDDRDGDDLCAPADPFPGCAANVAASCAVDRGDGEPPRPDAFLAGDICRALPALEPPACQIWAVRDEDTDGVIDRREVVSLDAGGRARRVETWEGEAQTDRQDIAVDHRGRITWSSGSSSLLERVPLGGFVRDILRRNDGAALDGDVWTERDGSGHVTQRTWETSSGHVVRRRYLPGRRDPFGQLVIDVELEDSIDETCTAAVARTVISDADGIPVAVSVDDGVDGRSEFEAEAIRDGGCSAAGPCTERVELPLDASGASVTYEKSIDAEGVLTVVLTASDDTDTALSATLEPVATVAQLALPAARRIAQLERLTPAARDVARLIYDGESRVVSVVLEQDAGPAGADGIVDAVTTYALEPLTGRVTRIERSAIAGDGLPDAWGTVTDLSPVATRTPLSLTAIEAPRVDLDNDGDTEVDYLGAVKWAAADGCAAHAGAPRCGVDRDCGDGEACSRIVPVADGGAPGGFGLAAFCAPRDPGTINAEQCYNGVPFNNPTCSSGLCLGGRCTSLCREDGDCGAGRVCRPGLWGMSDAEGRALGRCVALAFSPMGP